MSQPSVIRLVDLREEPLDVTEVVDALDDDASGGLTLFVGRVRDHDGGQGVVGLDYSAHPTALERLPRRVRPGRGGVRRPRARRRPPHRQPRHRRHRRDRRDRVAPTAATAFDASRALIDTLKAEVPIWKHQRFADGTDEWVGTP